MGLLTGIANALKKPITGWVKGYIGKYTCEYGTIANLEIDFSGKEITCSLDLKGESSEVIAVVKGIKVSKDDGNDYLFFDSITVSREWMNILVQNFLPKITGKNRIELPTMIAVLMKQVF